MGNLIQKIKKRREVRRRERDRKRRNVYYVEDLAFEDAQHDEEATLDEEKPSPRWIDAEEGDKGYQHYAWLEGRAEPLGKFHTYLARVKKELEEATRLLAMSEAQAAELRDNLKTRLRWFQDGLTKRQLLGIVLLVFVAEAIANYISFVLLPLPIAGQALFAVVFTVLVTIPAHYAGVLGIDAIFNWDHRHGEEVVERIHQKVVFGAALALLGLAVVLTFALGFMRDAYFGALRERHPEALFGAVDPTALTVALLLGALAGVVAIVLVAAKHQAGELRRKWTGELKLTEHERKQLEKRCTALRIEIAETEARYDVVAEKHAARGLKTRRRGAAIRAQFDRAWVNEQRRMGRNPDLPTPEPAPDPIPYYVPIFPAHKDLPTERPEEASAQNGAGDREAAKRLLAEQGDD